MNEDDHRACNEHIARFYDLMGELEDGLGGKRTLNECTGKQNWPKRGVYIIFECGETRFGRPSEMRVTRVGTHAIREGEESTLWGRIRHHRGTGSGGGNHRGSVFRKHVGAAIINRSNGTINAPSWAVGHPTREERQNERVLERLVSNYVGSTQILWLPIDDAPSPRSDRAYIERNSIALLSNPLNTDSPSKAWLGNYSPRSEVKISGLWNVDHVHQPYEPKFLDVLEGYVKKTT